MVGRMENRRGAGRMRNVIVVRLLFLAYGKEKGGGKLFGTRSVKNVTTFGELLSYAANRFHDNRKTPRGKHQ